MKLGYKQIIWIKLCSIFVKSFYSKVETSRADNISHNVPVILCANHSNALADAVLLQSTSRQLVHPLARSGLFKNPLLRLILSVWQAVPVYRRQDSDANEVDNDAMFEKAYEMLAANQTLMIFPEGQSHPGFHLKQIKTGVARIAIGFKEKYKITPLIIPVGLNFSQTKRFRSDVYINFGHPVEINSDVSINNDNDVRELTEKIMASMRELILEVNETEELDFIKQVDRFYSLRKNKLKKRSMSQKFKSHKYILSLNNHLKNRAPEKIKALQRHLNQFNRLCSRLGINDYNLNVRYNSHIIRLFIIRSLFVLFIVLPISVFGFINSLFPYLLTKVVTYIFAQKQDQQDTVKILAGTLFFSLFWITQTSYIYNEYSYVIALVYFLILVPSSLAALIVIKEQKKIIDNLGVFFVLIRRKHLRRYLIKKRKAIEKELALIINLVRNKSDQN